MSSAELKERLKKLEEEKKEIEITLKRIEGKEKGDKVISEIKESKGLLLQVFEKEDEVVDYFLSIRKQLKTEFGILINTKDLEYVYTVQRTDRDGLDNVSWETTDCRFCPSENEDVPIIHDLTFKDREISEKVEKKLEIDEEHDPEGKFRSLSETWEVGSEFELAHVTVDSLIGVAKRETWKFIRDSRAEQIKKEELEKKEDEDYSKSEALED